MVFRCDARDSRECPVQVCHVGAEPLLEAARAWRGHRLEPVLDVVDAADEFGGVRGGDGLLDLFAPAGQDEPASAVAAVLPVEPFEPLPRGHGPVVDAAGPAVAGAGASHGVMGRS